MRYFFIILFAVFFVYIFAKKFHIKKPLPFALLMGVVFTFLLWGIN